MDNRAGEMIVFVAVVDSGSFSAAARRLSLSPSAVSKLVTRLEDRLGTPLLVRTTRTLQPTVEGALYLERSRRILADIDDVERAVATGADVAPRGRLRVSASVAFGSQFVVPLVSRFLETYPQVELDLSLTDSVIDLVDERTDVALRSGPLRDSSLVARRLLTSRRLLVASPAYLAKHGTPTTPHELVDHDCLRFNFRRSLDDWPFRDPVDGSFTLPITGPAWANSGVILRALAVDGVGIARLSGYHVAADVEAGRLVAVLEDFNPGDLEHIHAVYVGHTHLAARIRAFVDFVAAAMPPADGARPNANAG